MSGRSGMCATAAPGYAQWTARIALGAVFAWNVQCAFVFLLSPERYVGGFELAGVPGEAAVRALGILFLMWNATYPPVIVRPAQHLTLFGVVLTQQAVGLAGELWLWRALPTGHDVLVETIARFAAFDGAGLLLMVVAFAVLWRGRERSG